MLWEHAAGDYEHLGVVFSNLSLQEFTVHVFAVAEDGAEVLLDYLQVVVDEGLVHFGGCGVSVMRCWFREVEMNKEERELTFSR